MTSKCVSGRLIGDTRRSGQAAPGIFSSNKGMQQLNLKQFFAKIEKERNLSEIKFV